MIKIFINSLGCPKNLVDSEYMIGALSSHGFIFTSVESADLIIINTCTFIDSATEESISVLNDALAKRKKGAKVLATGCLSQRYKEKLLQDIPGIDGLMGVDISNIIKVVEDLFRGGKGKVKKPTLCYPKDMPRALTTGFSAYLTVAGGCDNHCSYCIIPSIRGPFKSRRMGDIVEEAEKLAQIGAKELIIIAQDPLRYGLDLYGDFRIGKLLDELSQIQEIRWLRLAYCYPGRMDEALLEKMAKLPKVVKYLDMPIQHGDNGILKAMNRTYDREKALEIIRLARQYMPDISIRSSFIVGFPGEDDRAFENLLSFIREAQLDRVGFFAYSPQSGTKAAEMDYGIAPKKIQNRLQKLAIVQENISQEKLQAKIGQILDILVEGDELDNFQSPGLEPGELSECRLIGRDEGSAPEIDGLVYLKGAARPGTFVKAEIVDSGVHDMIGQIIGEIR